MKHSPKYIICIDLGGTNIKSSILNENLQVITERSDPTYASEGTDHVIKIIKNIIFEMMQLHHITKESVLCMGLGIPGLLNPKEGLSIFSPNFPGWENIHVVQEMNRDFSFPVFIDNDVRVNLYGEWYFGAGKRI